MVGLGRDRDEAVAGRENAVRNQRLMVVAVGPQRAPAHRILVGYLFAQRQDAVVHRDVDELTLSGLARGVNRGDHAQRRQRARIDIAHGGAGAIDRPALGAGEARQPAHRLGHDVEGRPVNVGTAAGSRIAKAANRAINQRRLAFAKGLIAKAHAVHRARRASSRPGRPRYRPA